MLETYSSQHIGDLHEDPGGALDIQYIIGILRRRVFYFVIPFVVIVALGALVIKLLKPIYRAQGEVLVQSSEIAPDLVHPTITELADEQYAVFRQRVMAGDNLLATVAKFNLFPQQRASLDQSQLLELMRERTEIKPIVLDARNNNSPAFAFSVAFEYEIPDIALNVTNEFLTEILSEDASRRTTSATETTMFLETEVKQLQT